MPGSMTCREAGPGSSIPISASRPLSSRITLMTVAALLVISLQCAAGPEAFAARKPVNITVPFRLSLQKVERGITEQLFTSPEGTCTIAEDKPGCRRLSLSAPQVTSVKKLLRITCDAAAQYGGDGGRDCDHPRQWQGKLELSVKPLFETAGRVLTFKVVEIAFYEKDRRAASVPGVPGDSLKKLIGERFERAALDCKPALDRFAGLLAALLPGGRERAEQALGSLSISQPQVYTFSLAMKLSFAIEPLPSGQKPPATMVRERREERLKRWDAFVTFVSKRLGRNRQQEQQRNVAGVLLDARYDLAAAHESPERRTFRSGAGTTCANLETPETGSAGAVPRVTLRAGPRSGKLYYRGQRACLTERPGEGSQLSGVR